MTIAAHQLTKESLIAFEERVKDAFLAQQIHAPVHLSGGNEDQLIEIFRQVRPQDWVLSTWRNHYHALLKGIPAEWLYQEILAGRSMYIESREHRFLSSSIVGGILPIAIGLAMGAKRKGTDERIWCFVGDMASRTGISHEALLYAIGHDLPLVNIEEDNGLSTNTPTREVWGENVVSYRLALKDVAMQFSHNRYQYERVFPHVGVGEWVTFG